MARMALRSEPPPVILSGTTNNSAAAGAAADGAGDRSALMWCSPVRFAPSEARPGAEQRARGAPENDRERRGRRKRPRRTHCRTYPFGRQGRRTGVRKPVEAGGASAPPASRRIRCRRRRAGRCGKCAHDWRRPDGTDGRIVPERQWRNRGARACRGSTRWRRRTPEKPRQSEASSPKPAEIAVEGIAQTRFGRRGRSRGTGRSRRPVRRQASTTPFSWTPSSCRSRGRRGTSVW